MKAVLYRALALFLWLEPFSAAQSNGDEGYIGYRLERRGDPESANYETASTPGVVLSEEPDVYLNASVGVGHIGIHVDNITAKVNLDAKVLKLLHFSAGVDASIDRVSLTIENVSAKVELEARLGNVVAMVGDVLNSIDLNPIIATLGQNVAKIINSTADTLLGDGAGGGEEGGGEGEGEGEGEEGGGASANAKRDLNFKLEHNILYSVNDYEGKAHTNRVLGQDGNLYDEFLDNDGNEQGRAVVGFYLNDMTFNGHNRTIEEDGQIKEFELQYEYKPFPGIEATSWIYVDTEGNVLRTQVIAEAHGGGSSSISNDSD